MFKHYNLLVHGRFRVLDKKVQTPELDIWKHPFSTFLLARPTIRSAWPIGIQNRVIMQGLKTRFIASNKCDHDLTIKSLKWASKKGEKSNFCQFYCGSWFSFMRGVARSKRDETSFVVYFCSFSSPEMSMFVDTVFRQKSTSSEISISWKTPVFATYLKVLKFFIK